MSPQGNPAYRSEGVIIDALAENMRFLRHFPDHFQAPEVWERVNAARAVPEIFYSALLIVAKEFEAEDDLVAHPENCPRCRGSGRLTWKGELRTCGCPEGDRLRRRLESAGQPMLEDQPLTTRQMFERRPVARPALQLPLISADYRALPRIATPVAPGRKPEPLADRQPEQAPGNDLKPITQADVDKLLRNRQGRKAG